MRRATCDRLRPADGDAATRRYSVIGVTDPYELGHDVDHAWLGVGDRVRPPRGRAGRPIAASGPGASQNACSGRMLPAAPWRNRAHPPPRISSTRSRSAPTKSGPLQRHLPPSDTGWQPNPTIVAMGEPS